MTEEQAKHLLQKYLEHHASPAEIKKVETWYASLNRKESNLSGDCKTAISEEIFSNLRLAMQGKPKHRKLFVFNGFAKIAAILLVSFTLAFSIWKYMGSNGKENLITVTTGPKERKKIILTDGSEVLLEPEAKLIYPDRFGASSRNISLTEGEAFFNIAHEERRPFTVHMISGLDVKVLGTSFRIKSYRNKHNIEVVVATGKVAVSNKKGLMSTLIKDQQLDYDKHANHISIRKVKQAAYVDFAFEGNTLQQIIGKLEYAYNIKIALSDAEMAKLKCTATFSSKQQPEEILDIICSLHHLKFSPSKNHKTFKIYK
ncbi:FecR family protein [Pedobacter nototheniae]|uniref:FecR family protein n=1 Tax=Pedobacter nototheniae TaxID=2488994 RepID=UPI002930936E|nr:FecR family protein [Pedobacter nototheniae]